MTTPCPVVHFEMPYDDADRVSQFYQAAFGWTMAPLGAEMNHYILAETTETQAGRPVTPGTINGGLFPRKPDWPAQAPLVVIGVDDMDAAIKRVQDAGGKVHGEAQEIPGVGPYVAGQDCEGNDFAMLQPVRPNS